MKAVDEMASGIFSWMPFLGLVTRNVMQCRRQQLKALVWEGYIADINSRRLGWVAHFGLEFGIYSYKLLTLSTQVTVVDDAEF